MAVVGIDFGSLHSKIGVARHRGIDIITNEVSNRATPSLIGFGPKSRAIGEPAKTQESSNFKNTVGAFKRLIGLSLDDPDVQQVEKKFINAQLIDVDGNVGVQVCCFPLFVSRSTWAEIDDRSTTQETVPPFLLPSLLLRTSASSVISHPPSSKSPSPTSSSPSQAGSPTSSVALSSTPLLSPT